MRKLLYLIFFLVSVSVFSQVDTSALDKMTPEELLKHYQNEKPPFSTFKGPEKVGDSLYNNLNPQVIPTQTVYADPLYHETDEFTVGKEEKPDTTSPSGQQMKPKFALGAGRLGYFGNMYLKHFQSPLVARSAFDLNISQRLTRFLQLNFNFLVGKLGADENLNGRHQNFQSEIRSGGVNLIYDFGNFIPDRFTVRPFVSFGVYGFEFLSKTDLKDKNGNTYYYWNDGSIKDKPQDAPDAQFANNLVRDYTYETDIRETNANGYGKYHEMALAFPIGAGAIAKVSDRVDFKLNFQLYFTTTNHIDGATNNFAGNNINVKQNNKFTYTSFAVQYDLTAKAKTKAQLHVDTLNEKFWFAFDNTDSDKDGVIDLKDNCQGTPEGVKVDANGCPLDDDGDGIPNYRDDELATPKGTPVNERGVGQTDDYWKEWYAQYMNDSTGADVKEEYIGGALTLERKNTILGSKRDLYTVELARYLGAIPSDEMAYLLSIGDIKSLTLEDGSTVVYVAGEYRKVKMAVKRRDEFRSEGVKGAVVSRIRGNNVEKISEEELEKILKKQFDEELKASGGNTLTAGTNTAAAGTNTTGAAGTNTATAGTNTTTAGTNTASAGTNTAAGTSTAATEFPEEFNKTDVVYRVQLGAFNKRISTSVFNTSAGVLELKSGEHSYRYVTKGFKTIEEAAAVRADLVIQGYSDAFVTAYKEGHRIPMNQTKATVSDKSYKEDLNENKMFSSVNKKLVSFKVQLGPIKKPGQEKEMDEKIRDLKNTEKQTTANGGIRYTAGKFGDMAAAEKYRKELEDQGFSDAFIIATFKENVISIQEALELMK